MKELSIEDKAKRYDEALHKAKRIINVCVDDNTECRSMIACIQQIFPELKESEDERILKQLRDFFKNHINSVYEEIDDNNDVLNWLEKQGEQKATIEMKSAEESLGIDSDTYNKIVDECIYGEQKPADVEEISFFEDFRKTDSEVEPKFHEGDWITNGDYTWKIVEVKPLDYILQSQDDNIVDDTISHVDEQFHSFTIEDAKDGDVLCCESGWTCVFKTLVNDKTFSSYCFMDNTKWFCETGSECHTLKKEFVKTYNGKIYPATKEQRDLLFQKIKEAGYEWDTDKKELKKIEQKPAWSKEDEKNLEKTIWYVEKGGKLIFAKLDKLVSWLKSLKDRVQPQQEWSKEDEGYYDAIIAKLEVTREDALLTDNEMDFLKSLEKRVFPKSNWNEEDITRLKSAITLIQNPLIACDEVNDGVRIKTVDWLKSIEGKVLLQSKQEWSEKDKHMLQKVIDFMNHPDLIKATPTLSKSTINWLEFLEERYTWKPSEEQITWLYRAADVSDKDSRMKQVLNELLSDLKKLI